MDGLAQINISAGSVADSGVVTATPLSPLNISVTCNTNGEITRGNIKSALARDLAKVNPLPAHDRIAVLVGGGPSLKAQWLELAWWQLQGADLFALNGTARFLNGHKIKPQFQAMIDPRPHNTLLIGEARSYLIASQCDPAVFDALEGKDVGLFHLVGSAMGMVDGTLIGGSITAGLATMCLAYTLGYRKIHLYGYDSSYAEGEHHAYQQDQTEQEQRTLDVTVFDRDGLPRQFTTNFAMAKQAELFPGVAEMLVNVDAEISVHGSGLLPTMAHAFKNVETERTIHE